MQFVYDSFINDYDWFVKLEHDSVVVPENIRYMTLMHQANIPGYAGQVLSGEKTTGSVHILSNQALRQLVLKLSECPDSVGGMADDLELDECLRVAGMSSSTDGRDQEGIQRFQIVMPDHKLPANTNGYSVWYWRYVRKPEIEVSKVHVTKYDPMRLLSVSVISISVKEAHCI
ncbi:glycoprotein-N-acetylgalactosamine 3-beta-galactosyltransferase 1-like [Amphiura filiformis]|uniref:glycoprotein-N-acetylgalactosamine 3-beta-galactosyltransferase 1-like n=1 Tax=Amphiura filiformis TaxID=82378 RepID=UPI003B20CC57